MWHRALVAEIELTSDELASRIDGILKILSSQWAAGTSSSSASKGAERELVVQQLLLTTFLPNMRFESGDIVDSYGESSGQVDVVLEYGTAVSFPATSGGPRVYLAENVAAVIEVKSDLAAQWDQVAAKSEAIASLKRRYEYEKFEYLLAKIDAGVENGKMRAAFEDGLKRSTPSKPIPFYVIGFEGWKMGKSLAEHVDDVPGLRGAYCINERLYSVGGPRAWTGVFSLLCLLSHLQNNFENASRSIFPTISEYVDSETKRRVAAHLERQTGDDGC